MINLEMHTGGFTVSMDGKSIFSHSVNSPFMYAGVGDEQIGRAHV